MVFIEQRPIFLFEYKIRAFFTEATNLSKIKVYYGGIVYVRLVKYPGRFHAMFYCERSKQSSFSYVDDNEGTTTAILGSFLNWYIDSFPRRVRLAQEFYSIK